MMFPSSTRNTPAMAFSIVDLPAPLPPITVTKSPSFRVRERLFKAVFALTVPLLNVFEIFFNSSIFHHLSASSFTDSSFPIRKGKEEAYDNSSNKLQVVCI